MTASVLAGGEGRKRIAPLLIVGAALVVAASSIFVGRTASVSAANPFDITFPIVELGGCTSLEDCRAYCDDLANAGACASFARSKGLATEEQVERAKEIPKAGPGGCNSESGCRTYCDDPGHTDECLAFAEEYDLLPKEELVRARALAGTVGPGGCRGASCKDYCGNSDHQDECLKFAEDNGLLGEPELREIKKGRAALQRFGGGPGGCRSEQQCRAYCDDSAHLNECLDFGEKSGFLSAEEAARIRKLSGGGPGGCKGRAECDAYCNDPANAEACVTFAVENNLISKEEAGRARKFAGKAGPGGCRGDACRTYCDDPSHGDECLAFAEREGLMPPEEIERAKKFRSLAAEAGPGGCLGERECRTFCENPVNRDSCFNFVKDKGLIASEELARFDRERGLEERVKSQGGPGGCRDEESCRQFCSNPSNTVACLNFAVEHGGFSREEASQSLEQWKQYREYGDQLRDNPDAFLAPPGQFGPQFGPPVGSQFGRPGFPPPIAGQVPPGFVPPGFSNFAVSFQAGPGGCSSPQECSQFCSRQENYGVCRDFFRGGQVQAVSQVSSAAASVEFGPGGCRGLSECLRYCQDPSHRQECSQFGSGPGPQPGIPGAPIDAPRFCPQVFDPVCGVNNITYGNRCEAGSTPIAYPGQCAPSFQPIPPVGGGLPGGCTTPECVQRYCSEPGRSQSPECRNIPVPQVPQVCPQGYRLEPLPQTGFTCRPVTEATGSGCTSEATCSAVCYNASVLDYNSQACIAFRQSRQSLPPVGVCPPGQNWYVSPGGGAGYCQFGAILPSGGCPSGEQWDGARCVAFSGGCVSESTCNAVCYNATHPEYNASSCVAFRQSRTQPTPTPTSGCDPALTALLGSGCHYMYNDPSGNSIYCDGSMTKSARRGDTATAPGCQAGGASGTPPGGQREQVWNSLGLRSWIRGDVDPARIEQLKQACANVPSSSYVWLPGAGDSYSPDFGMPDPTKCQTAATCAAGQTFDGAACISGGTYPGGSGGGQTCDSGLVNLLGTGCHYMYNDPSSGRPVFCDSGMARSARQGESTATTGCTTPGSGGTGGTYPGNESSCPGFSYSRWDGQGRRYCQLNSERRCDYNYPSYLTSGQNYTAANCPAESGGGQTCPAGQYWYTPPSGGAGYCQSSGTTSCPSGQYWNGNACVSSTSCLAGYHSMGSYCMSDSNSAVCQPFGGGGTYTCPGGTTTTACNYNSVCDYGESTGSCPSDCGGSATSCPSGQYWYTPPSGGVGYCQSSGSQTCPSGQYWNGSACVSSTTGSSCPSGYHSMGSYCMSDSESNTCQPLGGGGVYPCSGSTGGGSQTCPAGQYWYTPPSGGAGYCQSSGSTSCPSGQYWNGSSCVSSGTTSCPSDQYWDGSSCVPNPTTTSCPSGQYWSGSSCVTSTPSCPSGQYWDGSACVSSSPPPPPTCPSGQYWDGSACVPSTPPQSLVGTILNAFVNAFVAIFAR